MKRILHALRLRLACALVNRFKVPRDLVRWACAHHGAATALITPAGSWSFAALHARSLRLAQALRASGVAVGDVVMSQLPDGLELLELRLAAYECGAVLCGVPDYASQAQLQALRAAVTPRVCMTAQQSALAQQPPLAGCLHVQTGPQYEAWLACQPAARIEAAVSPQAVALIGSTSGTTGEPKIIAQTHGAQMTSLQMLLANTELSSLMLTPGPSMSAIPLSGAGSGLLLPALLSGSALVIPPAYTTEAVLQAAQQHGVRRLFVTPSQMADILDGGDAAQQQLASVEQIIFGTESMPLARLQEALQRYGPIFQQGYGSAEVLPPVVMYPTTALGQACQRGDTQRLRACGRVVQGVQVRIVDEDGQPVAAGVLGRIQVTSPTRFAGYWMAGGLAPSPAAQPLDMGDLGWLDAEGWLYVLGRAADLCRVGEGAHARSVHPTAMEACVYEHPAIKEAVWVPPPAACAPSTPAVMAVVLRTGLRPLQTDADWQAQLQQHLQHHLPADHGPCVVRLLPVLPRSPLGKLLRRDVPAALASVAAAPGVDAATGMDARAGTTTAAHAAEAAHSTEPA